MIQSDSLAIILSAGRGSRMNMAVPKPLVKVNDRSIVSWIIDDFKKLEIDIVLVINPQDEQFFFRYEDQVNLVFQNDPKGTGHAVMQVENLIEKYKYIYVFVGDCPFVGIDNISKMYKQHISSSSDMTILSSLFIDKKFPYARIIRDNKNNITQCIEEVDANEDQKKIKELFCSHYLFRTNILKKYLHRLEPNPKTKEIYFTDIINELIKDKKNICSLIVRDWKRLVGLNTKKDLKWIESQNII